MRFLSAQLNACLEDGLWLRHGRQANAMATRLARGLESAGIRLLQPVEANEIFAVFTAKLVTALRAEGFEFYEWPAPAGVTGPVVRLVTAYDVQAADVDLLLAAIGRLGTAP
jgi:threonine aldolase